MEEKLVVHVHYSKTGMPEDRQYAGILSATEDMTLNDLKKQVADCGIVPFVNKDTVFLLGLRSV